MTQLDKTGDGHPGDHPGRPRPPSVSRWSRCCTSRPATYTVTNTFTTNQYGEVGLAVGTHAADAAHRRRPPRHPGGRRRRRRQRRARRRARRRLVDQLPVRRELRPDAAVHLADQPGPRRCGRDHHRAGRSSTSATTSGSSTRPRRSPRPAALAVDVHEHPHRRAGRPRSAATSRSPRSTCSTTSPRSAPTTAGCRRSTTAPATASPSHAAATQRGAWDADDLARQQTKIVNAINALDADVVGLMEIENSAALGEPADEALATLVAALNADAGARYVGLRPVVDGAAAAAEHGRHHQRHHLQAGRRSQRVGESRALGTESDADEAFANAREPIGQVFKPDGGGEPFLVRRQPLQVEELGRSVAGRPRPRRRQGAFNESRDPPGHGAARLGPDRLGDDDEAVVPRRRLQLVHDGRPAADPLRRRATPTPSSTSPAASTRTPSPACPGSLDHVLAQRRGARPGHRRRHLGHQRRRVHRARVQPVQLPRHRSSTTRTRTARPTTTP